LNFSSVCDTYSESVTTNPDQDVHTNEHVIEPVNHDAVNPREQQWLAFKLLTQTNTQTDIVQEFVIFSFIVR